MTVVRRPPRTSQTFRGYTDAQGFKVQDLPPILLDVWPFGRSRPALDKAKAGEAKKAKIKAVLKALKD